MSDHHIKPGSPGDILTHHGVKGMRWGIRKEEESGGQPSGGKVGPREAANTNSSIKAYMAASKQLDAEPLTSAQVVKNLDQAQAKFDAKFTDGPSPSSKGKIGQVPEHNESLKDKWNNLSSDQKQLIIKTGIGVAVIGGLAIAGHRNRKAILALAGKPIENKKFNSHVLQTQLKVWGNGNFCKGDAFTRPAFELPAGHDFYRLTTSTETGFRDATYSLHSMEDTKRYIANFRHEKGPSVKMNLVRFTANEPTKVPNLHTVLGSLKEELGQSGYKISDKEVLKKYNDLSGGGWNSETARGLISRLKEKGYGALVDEMDAGVIGETPLVFFNNHVANPKEVAPLTEKVIHNAESSLIEINNRKL